MVCRGSWRRFLFTAGSPVGTAEWFQVYAVLLYMSTVFWSRRVFFLAASARSPEVLARRNIAPINRGCRQAAERAAHRLWVARTDPPDFETGDVPIGRHQRRWLIHASSTATVPSGALTTGTILEHRAVCRLTRRLRPVASCGVAHPVAHRASFDDPVDLGASPGRVGRGYPPFATAPFCLLGTGAVDKAWITPSTPCH